MFIVQSHTTFLDLLWTFLCLERF